ncbi:MAG: phosphoribosyl transferase [Bacteriovoracaceae bacterium]|nr:phosphoribosyl transferase [Bacteriovoracaceae bacterium]
MTTLQKLLPPCQNCDEPSRDLFCEKCLSELRFHKACITCGKAPLSRSLRECLPCATLKKPWDHLDVSFFYEGGIREFIFDFKDRGKPERLRELELNHLPKMDMKYDFIVPVTSDPSQTERRMYDSTTLLAKRLSDLWKIPVLPHAFERKKFLLSQKNLDAETRKKFLKKVVSLSPSVKSREFNHLLLIDDVLTTGATLEVHSKLLRKITDKLDVFCLGRALKA